ncbi:MAG TPA: MFS transporter, partial [Corynebacterium variabile]|nr:MFS transporter [Corynebacterium variabile]
MLDSFLSSTDSTTTAEPRRRLLRAPRVPHPHRTPLPRQTEMGRRRRPIAMLALALGGFGIGTTEFV